MKLRIILTLVPPFHSTKVKSYDFVANLYLYLSSYFFSTICFCIVEVEYS